MRSLSARDVLLSVALLLVPFSAAAVQVDITYAITGGNVTSSLPPANAGTPTGGTATVRWSLSSLNGNFLAGQPATVLNFTFMTTGSSTISSLFLLQGQPQAGHLGSGSISTGTLPTGIWPSGVGPTLTTIGHRTAITLGPYTLSAGIVNQLFPCTAALCGITTYVPFGILVLGQEVSRTLVPEPNVFPLLAMGGVLLAAYGYRQVRA